MEKITKKVYRHWYDNPKDHHGDTKPNELLGEFEFTTDELKNYGNDYNFETTAIKNGKKYKIIGQEVSGLADSYNAGTMIFAELIE